MSGQPYTFSKRTAWDLGPSDHSIAVATAGSRRSDLLDLTVSNPNQCGFDYEADAILGPLAHRAVMQHALTYDPDPRGMRSAREAVSRYYAERGASVDPNALVLATSTSEAYSFLFRLLCDPGDEVLVAQPSYPLFDFLAVLDDVKLTPYPLFHDFGWWIDFAELERRITSKTRAILVVHPNNPTGHWTHRPERERLEAICERYRLALIVDEVFLDYPFTDHPAQSFVTGPHPVVTFVLSGLSKVAALPQMKVAWLATFGPSGALREALARLEVIADTFLSMNTPAQLAAPEWLAGRGNIRRQINQRIKTNLEILEGSGLKVLHTEAGWSTVVRYSSNQDPLERTAAEALLQDAGIIVHPASFYGLADAKAVVLSLLTPSATIHAAAERLRARST